MKTLINGKIHTAAAKGLVRALRNDYSDSLSLWVWRWLDRNGVEPGDVQEFTRAVVRRAHQVLGADLLCTGYPRSRS